jgi:hypothetical protein
MENCEVADAMLLILLGRLSVAQFLRAFSEKTRAREIQDSWIVIRESRILKRERRVVAREW